MRDDHESSLELLLDTMCNTFGGVIFITIALVVIISMTSSLRQQKTNDENRMDARELQTGLAELQEQLRQMDARQAELVGQMATASSDPRLQMMEEIAVLEASVNRREMEAELARKTLESVVSEAGVVEKELREARESLEHHSDEIEKNARAREEIASQLEALRQKQEASALNMVFTTMA